MSTAPVLPVQQKAQLLRTGTELDFLKYRGPEPEFYPHAPENCFSSLVQCEIEMLAQILNTDTRNSGSTQWW